MSSWFLLMIAIGFEVAGTTCMKLSNGFTRLWPSIGIYAFFALALLFLTLALKRLDVGLLYAVWSGVGTLAIVIIGMVLFGESMSALKVLFIALILIGVIGLKILSSSAG